MITVCAVKSEEEREIGMVKKPKRKRKREPSIAYFPMIFMAASDQLELCKKAFPEAEFLEEGPYIRVSTGYNKTVLENTK